MDSGLCGSAHFQLRAATRLRAMGSPSDEDAEEEAEDGHEDLSGTRRRTKPSGAVCNNLM